MGSIKKLKKGEYTVTQWTKKHSELNQTNPDEQDDLLEDVSPQATDLQVTETTIKEYTSMKKNEVKKKKNKVKKKKNEAKKKIEKKKCITPLSSPEFIHVPSTAEKKARGQGSKKPTISKGKRA
jgi:hypothetical protein